MERSDQVAKARQIIAEMKDDPRINHPKDQRMHAKEDCVRIEVPGLVDIRYVGHNGENTFITVVPKQE
ncbi:hypothetical protein [Glycomyces xiaoerkulensis]|uniref:hypothetical protein n=1 Tax=Glycomyces xiaoerkulensis TaxID=2038139 RepID=UPI0012FFD81B|nr:hypothetical protein [Glycomyces xiaoerkulensis]